MNLRHILFPFDFSPRAHQIVRYVASLASRTNARVTLLSVLPPTFDGVPADMGNDLRVGDDAAGWVANLQTRLDRQLTAEFAPVHVARVAVGGDPALQIVAYAERERVDLVMMPTHGLGVFRTMLIGSVTAKVLHDARCPVWTAAHAETQVARPDVRTVLCAVDGGTGTESLLRWAGDFAALMSARLFVLHVVAPVTDWPELPSERRMQEQVRCEAQRELVALMRRARVDAPLRVLVGPISDTVAMQADIEHADVAVLGRGSVTEPFGRLRTHAFGIVQRAPCPVISV